MAVLPHERQRTRRSVRGVNHVFMMVRGARDGARAWRCQSAAPIKPLPCHAVRARPAWMACIIPLHSGRIRDQLAVPPPGSINHQTRQERSSQLPPDRPGSPVLFPPVPHDNEASSSQLAQPRPITAAPDFSFPCSYPDRNHALAGLTPDRCGEEPGCWAPGGAAGPAARCGCC